jgi:hypothetical protein
MMMEWRQCAVECHWQATRVGSETEGLSAIEIGDEI